MNNPSKRPEEQPTLSHVEDAVYYRVIDNTYWKLDGYREDGANWSKMFSAVEQCCDSVCRNCAHGMITRQQKRERNK